MKTPVITLQIGSNDPENKDPDKVIECFETWILKIHHLLPESEIVVNEILPKFYENTAQSRIYESRRKKLNVMLKDLCAAMAVKYVYGCHSNISYILLFDDVHLHTCRHIRTR